MTITMMFLVLVFAHMLADYPLQGDFLANMKGKNLIVLATHAGIWTGTICTALWLMGLSVTLTDITWLCIVHAIADYLKAKPVWFYKKLNPLGSGLLIDQVIHILQIIILLVYKTI
ncbi:hypothetical protein J41TS2_24820 [Bacillus sonorensis]|uniref:DUF3307 domain-containing protein n=1 Tax=Bacillus sonorensis TaxID=119858 RepID=UPI001B165D7E|nr:DUF3307 domain-containing protein [Bacillus sonorensis]GIN67061.1 hypothetical protein J41TS2_24820 [Bacillus sonorensis]